MGSLRLGSSTLARCAVAAGLLGLSCGSEGDAARRRHLPSGPTAEAQPVPGLRASSDLETTPETAWIPPGTFDCPLGKGDPKAWCEAGTPARFEAEVDRAIEQVVREQPGLFQAGDVSGKILDEEPFHLAVARLLQERGFCTGWDLLDLQVRNSAGFSEQYDLFDRGGHLRHREDRLRSTCTPASFPLDAAERIDSLRLGFYGITCADGRTPPRNGEGRLPMGCTGFVTATPKDARGADVDARVHGPYITWELEQRYEFVRVEDYPDVRFNKILKPASRGEFRLCATVQTHTDCIAVRVTAN
jgi:hypothetical protein